MADNDQEKRADKTEPSIGNVARFPVSHSALGDVDLEAVLSQAIDSAAPIISLSDNVEPGAENYLTPAELVKKYGADTKITFNEFMRLYSFHPIYIEQSLDFAGNLDPKRDENIFYIVAVKKPADDVEVSTEQWPKTIIVTTIKSKDKNASLYNSLASKIVLMEKTAPVLYSATITDLLNIIEAMKSRYTASLKSKADESENKEDSRAKIVFRQIVEDALKADATDIHIMQQKTTAVVRFTIDGQMVDYQEIDKGFADRLIVYALWNSSPEYKDMASSDELADARLVDKFNVQRTVITNGREEVVTVKELVTLRVGKTPSNYGPHTTMRIFPETEGKKIVLEDLGLDHDNLMLLKKAIEKPSGILFMTGPTGSGKTTTLAGCYEAIAQHKKIIVLEDPIEIRLQHRNAVQSAVEPGSPTKDYNAFLKLALRQRPHVIGMSEVRDGEVASMVFRAAMTGHLMISTIHTNGSVETIVRLNDLGIEYGLMAVEGLLDTIAAQRLLRKLCQKCRIPYQDANPKVGMAYKANHDGCPNCDHGYRGRIVLSEVFVFDSKIRELVTKPNNVALIKEYLRSKGWRSLADRALEKVRAGLIDVVEAREHVQMFLDESDEADYTSIA